MKWNASALKSESVTFHILEEGNEMYWSRAKGRMKCQRDYHKFTCSNSLLYIWRVWKSEWNRKQVQYRNKSKRDGNNPEDNPYYQYSMSWLGAYSINYMKLKIPFLWVKSYWIYVAMYQVSGSCTTLVIRNRRKCRSALVQQTKDREWEKGREKRGGKEPLILIM